MSKKQSIIFFTVLLIVSAGLFFVFNNNTEAYGTGSTHPFLTKQIANLYNAIYTPKLTDEQIKQMIEGSVDEDTMPRWINHFYDPTTGDGLLGKRLGDLPSEDIIGFIKVVFNEIPSSTLDWVHNQELQQNSYALFEGNRTFESAALSYVDNKNSEAYYNLGYVLHNIEDMAVPAHTRQDSHFDMQIPDIIQNQLPIKLDKGEPYEKWAESYTRYNPIDLAETLKKDYKPICDSLDNCLRTLAEYSNETFFSSDTIKDEEYNLPKITYVIDKKDGEAGDIISTYFSSDNTPLARAKINIDLGEIEGPSLKYSDIHQAYWDRLAPKAVLAGVEVIRYFQDQAEKAKKGEITINRVSETINPIEDLKNFSPYGQFVLMYNEGKASVQDFWDRLKNLPSDFASHFTDTLNEGKASAQDFWHKLTNFGNDITSKFNDLLDGLGIRAFLTSILPGFALQESNSENSNANDNSAGNNQVNQDIVNLTDYTGAGGPSPALTTDQERQDLLDDIAEQLDIIAQQVRELQNKRQRQNLGQTPNPNQNSDTQNSQSNNQNTNNNINSSGSGNSSSGGGGGSSIVFPKILISEAQAASITDSKEEFVELYNPNDAEVDLTSWYLQRKTTAGSDYSTFAPNTLFSGKKIGAKGYFVIARTGYFSSIADILVDAPITDDNSFVLKNPNGEVSDKLGFGQAQDYESVSASNPGAGQSIGRKVLTDDTEQDTDNNSADFELQSPTPKVKNSTLIAPPLPPLPVDTLAPQIAFNLNAVQTDLSFAIDFTITDPLDTVSPSGIDRYVFRWQEQGGSWQEDAPAEVRGPSSMDIARDFTGEDEKTYYFQAKARDIAGNESDWLPETPAFTKIRIPKKIVINEIQTDSIVDPGGTNNDWVELYNPNNADVSLTDWSLQKHSKDDPCSLDAAFKKINFPDDAVITAKSYFLIVRNSANQELLDIADITSSYLQLSADNTIYLVRNQDKIESDADTDIADKVGFGSACYSETSPAPAPPEAKSIERRIPSQDTDNNSQDFKISDEPTPRAGSPKTFIEDATNYETCGGSSLPGTLYCYLKIKWWSPSLVSSYQIQYKLNNVDWKDWLADTTATEGTLQTPYSLFNDNIYRFRVRAKDTEGNIGDWAEIEKEVELVNPVSINEVALFGTNSSRDDQWVELYNKSDKDVDLTGWKLVSDSGTIELEGTILAKGYFLLERNDTNFTETLGTSSLNLINENSRFIDQIYAPQGGWTSDRFIIEDNYYTLERISPYSFGMDDKNWRINNGIANGTPARQNSVYQIYTSYYLGFEEDTILRKELSPYLFWGPWMWVFKNHTLTIEPGTIIKFSNGGLTIGGTLKAIGTPDQKIIFTSFMDDDCGTTPACGDTDGDAGISQPNPGNWFGIYLTKDSTGSELENVNIRYAGGYFGNDFGAAIKADRSDFSLKDSVIEKNSNNGLRLIDSHSIVDSVRFLENKTAEWPSAAKAIYIEGENPEIRNSYFKDNKYGIFITHWYDSEKDIRVPAIPVIENNIFEENSTPIWIGSYSHPSLTNNSGTNNDRNAIVFSGPVEEDTTLKPDILPYFIEIMVTVSQGATLTVEPGTIVKFSNSGLIIDGTLKAVGTPDSPIIFKPYFEEDRVSPGNWLGIYFTKNSVNSELENVDISYAGGYFGSDFGAAIRVDQSSIFLKNSKLWKNANNGVRLIGSASVIDNVKFFEHRIPSENASAVLIQGGAPEIKNSHFQGQVYGIYKNTCPMANLHTSDPEDPERNYFIDSEIMDIFDPTPP